MTRPLYGLITVGSTSRANQTRLAARYAALIDALAANQRITRVNGSLLKGAIHQGFIDDTHTLTAHGRDWRAGCPVPPVAFEAICGRKPVQYTPKQNAAFRQYAQPTINAQPFIEAGMILVDGEFIRKAGPEELKLWGIAKLHESDGLTYADLASLLGWPIEHVRIRAERIAAIGGVLAVKDKDAA